MSVREYFIGLPGDMIRTILTGRDATSSHLPSHYQALVDEQKSPINPLEGRGKTSHDLRIACLYEVIKSGNLLEVSINGEVKILKYIGLKYIEDECTHDFCLPEDETQTINLGKDQIERWKKITVKK